MNGKNEIRVCELFAGIGGFRLGLEQANNNREFLQKQKTESLHGSTDITRRSSRVNGFRVIWANEWDKYAASIYRKNFGEKELVEGDITKIEADNIPDFDLLCGGFPCQPFSLAGKRQGFKDLRGTMFFEIARIAEAKKPSLLLLENVKGLLSHDNGDTFEAITRTLDGLGYDVEWQVLNSKYFGVPQNRERVFIIGHLRGTSTRQIFPITGDGAKDNRKRQVAGCLQGGGHSGGLHSNMTGLVSKSVRSGGRGSLDRHSWDLIQLNDDGGHQVNRVYSVEGLSPTVPTACDGGHIPKIAQALQTDGFLRQGSSFGSNNPQSSRNIRRLTPTECERLQGFPDDWTKYGIEYKQVQRVSNLWQGLNVQWKAAQGTALSENQDYVLCTTNDGAKGAIQTSLTLIPTSLWQKSSANIVIGLVKIVQEVCVEDITNLGKDTVMLSKLSETSSIEQITKQNLICERTAEKSTYPLLNLLLEENCPRAKLSIILTLIKEIIESKTYISVQTGEPITSVIIHLNKLPNHYLKTELSVSKTATIVEISDTQRYKCLGNAVTVNVVRFLGKKILEACIG